MKTYQIKVASSARHNLACGHATSTTCYAETVTFSQLALFKVQHSGFSVRRSMFNVPNPPLTVGFGLWIFDRGLWTPDFGLWTRHRRLSALNGVQRPLFADKKTMTHQIPINPSTPRTINSSHPVRPSST